MAKTLVIIGHQSYKDSIYNKKLVEAIISIDDVKVHILQENFDVDKEQALLNEYENIVLQYPLYWFSTTPLLKSWLDKVFAYGYAYGPDGDKLENKNFGIAITTSSILSAYSTFGHNKFTLEQFLLPMVGTFNFTRSNLVGIFYMNGCLPGSPNEISCEELDKKSEEYKVFVTSIGNK